MLTDKRIIECENKVREFLRVTPQDHTSPGMIMQCDIADALAELLRWRERSNQIAKEFSDAAQ